MKLSITLLIAHLSMIDAYLPVKSSDITQNPNPPSRKDLTTMSTAEYNLFVLAMQQWQKAGTGDVGGYYQVAGIHGAPYQYWDNSGNYQNTGQGDKDGGYCHHGTNNFYMWHRPYLALFEQQMQAIAVNISNTWVSSQRSTYQAAARTLKMPYWDWARSGTVPLRISAAKITVPIPKTGASQVIANPLYSHTEVSGGTVNIGTSSKPKTTYRSSTYVKDMSSQFAPLQKYTALLFNTANVCWNRFATYDSNEQNTGCSGSASINSLESIHNTVHNTICGTMCNLDTAAFDAIFWLHHCNVDRIGALWQYLNPNTKQPSTVSSSGNYVWNSGVKRGDNFQYMPFRWRNTNTDWWTPSMSYDVRTAGYTYPEIADRPSVSTLQSRVNAIYGTGRTQQTVSTSKAKRGDEVVAVFARQSSGNLIDPPAPAALEPFRSVLITSNNGSFAEYSIECTISKSVATGSFTVYFFFGNVDAVRVSNHDYLDAPNRIGGFSVTQRSSASGSKVASGVVFITDPLLNTMIAGKIKDLKPATVRKWVNSQLTWRLLTADGTDIGGAARGAGLKIKVRRSVITPDGTARAAVPLVAAPAEIADTTDNTEAAAVPSDLAATTSSTTTVTPSAFPTSTSTSTSTSTA